MNKDSLHTAKSGNETPDIFKKMFFGFVVVPIIPILALFYFTYSAQVEREKFVENSLINSAQLIGANVDKWIDRNVYVSLLMSQLEDMISMDPQKQKPLLVAIKENSSAITAVRVDDKEGYAITRSDDKVLKNYADRQYFQQVKLGEPVGQQVIFGKTQQKPLLCFTVPINDIKYVTSGGFLGALSQCSILDDISTNVTNLKIGETGFAFLLDQSNQLIAYGGSDKRLSGKLEDMSNHPAVKDNKIGIFSFEADSKEVLAYKTTVGLGWTLVVQQDYKEAFAAPITARNNAVATVILTALACLSIIYLMSKLIAKPIQDARDETDNILKAANDGLFLIDKNYVIGQQQSANLSNILQKDELSGKSFMQYLNQAVPIDVSQMAKDYIDLLFSNRVKEALVESRNPLKMVQTSIEDKNGQLETKYLSLTFKRIYEDRQIVNLFVTAKDITKEVMLQKEIEKMQEDKHQQMDLLTDMLHIPVSQLNSFLSETLTTLNDINFILEQPGSDVVTYRKKIEDIFKAIHKVKGDASSIKFELIVKECHSFEDMLMEMRGHQNNLSGNEFLPIALALDELFMKCQTVEELLDKIGAYSASPKGSDSDLPEHLQQWYQLKYLADNLAEKHGKSVDVHLKGFKSKLPKKYHLALKDIATQMVRNSIAHGIEEPSVRRQKAKVQDGQITMMIKRGQQSGFSFTYMDDGQGIDFEAIKDKVVANGMVSLEEADSFSEDKLIQFMFHSGFSIKDKADSDAGRGVGLALVIDKVKEFNGKIKVTSTFGKRVMFKITLPDDPVLTA